MGKLFEGIYHYEYIFSAQVVTYLHFSSDTKIKIKSKSTVNDGNSADVSCLSSRVQVLKETEAELVVIPFGLTQAVQPSDIIL